MEDIESHIVRLIAHVRSRQTDGWSETYAAVVDPGSPSCLVPRAAWATADHRILCEPTVRVSGIGSGVATARFGELTILAEDAAVASPPLTVRALLLDDDSEPLLLGFEDFLTYATLHCSYPHRVAYLEFAAGTSSTGGKE